MRWFAIVLKLCKSKAGAGDAEDVDGEDVDGEDVDGEDVDAEDVDGDDGNGEFVDREDGDGLEGAGSWNRCAMIAEIIYRISIFAAKVKLYPDASVGLMFRK
jgi:hypothetical protein